MTRSALKTKNPVPDGEDALAFFFAKLKRDGMSPHTLESYEFAIKSYLRNYGEVSEKKLAAWRGDLIDRFKPNTVNIRLAAMNTYLKYLKKHSFLLKNVKTQQKPFLDNVISLEDYEFLKKQLKKDGDAEAYFMVWFLAATGTRVSEFVRLKIEHVKSGHFDLYGKGGKMRRLYIPKTLRAEALAFFESKRSDTGYLFRGAGLESNGGHISTRGVSSRLQRIAKKYDIDKAIMHPHSFRHLFGKTFFERTKDLSLLADLMGHESIDTTRIYTRRTATEQRALVDEVVTW